MRTDRRAPVDIAARTRAAEDLDTSFCLEAGAGTGKTTILVERIVSILRRGRAQSGGIVAITFTEKAAAEMKARVQARIAGLLADESLPPAQRERLAAGRRDLERAQISTIHAFASALLHEYPIEGGVDPRFKVLDGIDAAIFLEECFEDFLAGADARHEPALRRLIGVLGGSGAVEHLRAIAKLRYRFRGRREPAAAPLAGARPGGVDAGAGAQDAPGGESPESLCGLSARRELYLERAGELRRLAAAHCTSVADNGYGEIVRFHEQASALGAARDDDELEHLLVTLVPPAAKGNRKNWSPPEACARQKEMAAALGEEHERFRRRWMSGLAGGLAGWCEAFARFADERKHARSVLDFDDLLIRARRLLRDRTALDDLRARYRFILVDEFQDTDPLQAEIIMLLAAAPGAAGTEPEPGKLFVVGDPKQSIYRFRGADVEVYQRVRDMIAGSGQPISITQNFRSLPGIVDWVNEAFSNLMQRPADGRYQPEYEWIHSWREQDGPAVHLLDLETSAVNADELRAIEGEAVARLARRIVEGGCQVTDPRTQQRRSARYGDIALIYRGTTGIDRYEDPLRAQGVPYLVEGGTMYYARQEVRDLSSALWAIEDPYDTLALAAVLRSPLFGFSDEEIFLFTRAGGRLDYLDPGAARGASEDVLEALALLAALHRGRNETGAAQTLRRLLAETGYLALQKLTLHGRQAVLNVRKVLQTARVFDERMHPFRYFARWMRNQDMLGTREGESPEIDEDEDAVRLLTIHKAKGLQFPVVILVNLVQKERGGGGVIVGPDGSLALQLSGGWRTENFEDRAATERRMIEAETIRLLYVAVTRARDMLVVTRVPDGKGLYGAIAPFLERQAARVGILRSSELPAPILGRGPFLVAPAASAAAAVRCARERDEWLAGRRALLAGACAAPAVIAPSGLVPHMAPGGAVHSPPAGDSPAAAAALAFGSAFHRLMELVLSVSAGAGIGAAARAAAAEYLISEQEAPLRELGERALRSSLMREAAGAEELYCEVPFIIPLEAAPAAASDAPWEWGNMLEGRIDLLFQRGGRWTVVDFKTDDVEAARAGERAASYRAQAAAYAYALRALGIEAVERIVFFFVRPGKTVTAGDVETLASEGESLVRAAAAFPPCAT